MDDNGCGFKIQKRSFERTIRRAQGPLGFGVPECGAQAGGRGGGQFLEKIGKCLFHARRIFDF